MDNFELENGIYRFSVNGGDSRTTKWAYGVSALIPLVFSGLYFGAGLGESLPIPSVVWAVLCGLLVAAVYFWLSKGTKARYEVRINKNNRSIKAFDRINNEEMWEDVFQAENIYRSNIQVIVSGQVYRYPVLAYGSLQKEIIEDGVPYVDRILLGFGEEQEVDEMIKELKD
jgi:hypothetical protein